MGTRVKTEGFAVPGGVHAFSRPSYHRPASDGSKTIETAMLTSIDRRHSDLTSPFSFSTSIGSFDHSFPSYHTSPVSLDLPHVNAYQTPFGAYSLGNANPEPPIHMSMVEERSRCHSSSGVSQMGKAIPSHVNGPRKLSINEVGLMSPLATVPPRGRMVQATRSQTQGSHSRTLSHDNIYPARSGLDITLDNHDDGVIKDTVSPSEFGPICAYGRSAGQITAGQSTSWGSLPSLMPGSQGRQGDDTFLDSPVTPIQGMPILPTDETIKRQRRRECHNQVEKRRREHINSKIEELSQLLPPAYSADEIIEDDEEDDVKGSPTKKKRKRSASTLKQMKDANQCKGRILSQTVEYVHYLQTQITQLGSMLAVCQGLPQHDSNSYVSAESFALPAHLEVLRPSPEPERPASDWNERLGFDPSPTTLSSGSADRRSSSLSTVESVEQLSPLDVNGPTKEVRQDRQKERSGRIDSAAGIQVSMSGIDLDAMFNMRSEGDLAVELRY